MKVAEVFNLYNHIMKNYDDCLRGNALKKCGVSFSLDEQKGILRASENASKVAKTYLEKVNNSENKITFKEIYSAALRVELYRQFVAKGQQLNNYDEIINAIESYINSETIKYKNIPNVVNANLFIILTDFGSRVESIKNGSKSAEEKLNEFKNAALQFELEAITLFQENQIKYAHEISWWPFFANLMLVVLGIGIGSFIYRGCGGHYLFADNLFVDKTEARKQDHLVVKNTVNYLKDLGFFHPADAKFESKSPNINKEPEVNKTLSKLGEEARREIIKAEWQFGQHIEKLDTGSHLEELDLILSQLRIIAKTDDLQIIGESLEKLKNSVSYRNENDKHKCEVMRFVSKVREACEPIADFVKPDI
ncbi:MAG: hypothetical protein H0U73_08475, partial [Tatlockia sp.]|nr:hypothetical protein [Tatlockia sp.]